jgi:hypothetical protein
MKLLSRALARDQEPSFFTGVQSLFNHIQSVQLRAESFLKTFPTSDDLTQNSDFFLPLITFLQFLISAFDETLRSLDLDPSTFFTSLTLHVKRDIRENLMFHSRKS